MPIQQKERLSLGDAYVKEIQDRTRTDNEKYKESLSKKIKDYKKALALRNPVTAEIQDEYSWPPLDPTGDNSGVLAYVPHSDRTKIYLPERPSGGTLPNVYNHVIPHELMHTVNEKHSGNSDDLMHSSVKRPIDKQSLSKKIRKYALQNLEKEEEDINRASALENSVLSEPSFTDKLLNRQPTDMYSPGNKIKNPPIPVREMYNRIERQQPLSKKYKWWSDNIGGGE